MPGANTRRLAVCNRCGGNTSPRPKTKGREAALAVVERSRDQPTPEINSAGESDVACRWTARSRESGCCTWSGHKRNQHERSSTMLRAGIGVATETAEKFTQNRCHQEEKKIRHVMPPKGPEGEPETRRGRFFCRHWRIRPPKNPHCDV